MRRSQNVFNSEVRPKPDIYWKYDFVYDSSLVRINAHSGEAQEGHEVIPPLISPMTYINIYLNKTKLNIKDLQQQIT